MNVYAVKLEKSGRILIPAEIRRRFGLESGQDVLIGADERGVTVVGNRAAAVRGLQERMRSFKLDCSLAEELIAERRAEASAEEG
jgi:AbrB family looped-hinge helix DNA binding protein